MAVVVVVCFCGNFTVEPLISETSHGWITKNRIARTAIKAPLTSITTFILGLVEK